MFVIFVFSIIKKNVKENEKKPGTFNINCLDPLGRTALIVSIENENMEMIDMLLSQKNIITGVINSPPQSISVERYYFDILRY